MSVTTSGLAAVGMSLMVVSWLVPFEKAKPRYSIEREQQDQLNAAWRRFCVHYHVNRDTMANMDMDIMCFKYREMVP